MSSSKLQNHVNDLVAQGAAIQYIDHPYNDGTHPVVAVHWGKDKQGRYLRWCGWWPADQSSIHHLRYHRAKQVGQYVLFADDQGTTVAAIGPWRQFPLVPAEEWLDAEVRWRDAMTDDRARKGFEDFFATA